MQNWTARDRCSDFSDSIVVILAIAYFVDLFPDAHGDFLGVQTTGGHGGRPGL